MLLGGGIGLLMLDGCGGRGEKWEEVGLREGNWRRPLLWVLLGAKWLDWRAKYSASNHFSTTTLIEEIECSAIGC